MKAWLLALAFLLAQPAGGTVTRVVDGDGLDVAGVGTIRLIGVDAPELTSETDGRCGRLARQFMVDLVGDGPVALKYEGKTRDVYGRVLAYVVLASGKSVNAEMVRNGWARVYRATWFRDLSAYERLEAEARERKLGIWAIGSAACAAAESGGYRGNLRSRVFHAKACPYYRCENCVAEFKSRREAEAAGFRAHRECVK
jgi:micrococcal nuclease